MADDEMTIKIPVPSDSKGRIMLSDEQWSARLNRAISEAARRDSVNWNFDRVMGRDAAGNVVVRVRQERPRENAARSGNDRPDRAEAARAEAARRQAQRQQTREQQRGTQGRDR